jgi:hypothetical protein
MISLSSALPLIQLGEVEQLHLIPDSPNFAAGTAKDTVIGALQ